MDRLEAAARSQGWMHNRFVTEGVRGWIAARRGDLARAEETLRPLVDVAAAGGMPLALVTSLWWMGEAVLERPSLDDLAAVSESIELPAKFTKVAGGAWGLLARGPVRAALDGADAVQPQHVSHRGGAVAELARADREHVGRLRRDPAVVIPAEPTNRRCPRLGRTRGRQGSALHYSVVWV